MSIVKLCWSGGKDSTASIILHKRNSDYIKAVYYIPMLTDEIPLITKRHYNFILDAVEFLKSENTIFYRANGITYYDHVHTIKTRGQYKGTARGIALGFGFCGFRDRSKRYALDNINIGDFDYTDIGIAVDETRRLSQLSYEKRSILADEGYSEKKAKELCRAYGLLSPVYESGNRDGCVICPNANDQRLKEWAQDYPQGKQILLEIEKEFNGPKDVIYRDGSKWSNHMDK